MSDAHLVRALEQLDRQRAALQEVVRSWQTAPAAVKYLIIQIEGRATSALAEIEAARIEAARAAPSEEAV